MSVNLWGVIYGVRTFVPIMLAQNTECHTVNTASSWGLTTGSGNGAYRVSKHAVVSFSETLSHELAERESKIKVSVLCPTGIKSSITEPLLQDFPSYDIPDRELRKLQTFHRNMQAGRPPALVADCVFDAIRNEQFYILFAPSVRDGVKRRLEGILQEQNPD